MRKVAIRSAVRVVAAIGSVEKSFDGMRLGVWLGAGELSNFAFRLFGYKLVRHASLVHGDSGTESRMTLSNLRAEWRLSNQEC